MARQRPRLAAAAAVLLALCWLATLQLTSASTHPAAYSSRRSLLQLGTARFMNAPILSADELEGEEAGPSQRTKQQPAKPAAAGTVVAPPTTTTTAPAAAAPSSQNSSKAAAAKQQARGLLSTNTRRRHYDRRWRQDRLSRYRRYDRSSLAPLLGSANSYSNVRRQPLPLLTGILGSLLQPGNPRGTAQSLATAYSGGQSDVAAQAVASAAAGQGSQAETVAQGLSNMAVNHRTVLPGLLARSADYAVTRGQTDRYASTLADAFGYAQQQQQVPQLTEAVCEAINKGGDSAKYASGTAIATAIAQGGDSKAAVAEATATALCAGGSQAQAWSSAYAVALAKDQNGCLVLNEAKAMAQAKCGDGAADAVANTEASSSVLGFCGLLEGFFPDEEVSFSGSNSGSTSSIDSWGQQGAWGRK